MGKRLRYIRHDTSSSSLSRIWFIDVSLALAGCWKMIPVSPMHHRRQTHGCPSWDIYVNCPSASLLHSNVPTHSSLCSACILASDVSGPFAFVRRRRIFSSYLQYGAKRLITLWRILSESCSNISGIMREKVDLTENF